MSVEVTINGERRELPDGSTVASVVASAGMPADGRGVAVAVDGAVLPRMEWETTAVRGGARLELVSAVQGG